MRSHVLAIAERLHLLPFVFRAREAFLSLRPYPYAARRPLPSARLRVRSAGTADPRWFVESGERTAAMLDNVLSRYADLRGMRRVLDFGCGCGRVSAPFGHLRTVELHGCDPNAEAVRWCAKSIQGSFVVQPKTPPLSYRDGYFDAVFAISVFTHLPDEIGRSWLHELVRVIRDGGLLITTTHGDHYRGRLDAREREAYDRGDLVVRRTAAAGSNLCMAFHPIQYVREVLAKDFALVEFVPGGAAGIPQQDLIILRHTANV
jgi:SAM-dependent methyltransferase